MTKSGGSTYLATTQASLGDAFYRISLNIDTTPQTGTVVSSSSHTTFTPAVAQASPTGRGAPTSVPASVTTATGGAPSRTASLPSNDSQHGAAPNPSPNPYGGRVVMGPAAPTITDITPNASVVDKWSYPSSDSAVSSFKPVTITGSGFSGATKVMFGSWPAKSFKVDSDTKITATPPTYTWSSASLENRYYNIPKQVTVITPGGTSATSTVDTFYFGGFNDPQDAGGNLRWGKFSPAPLSAAASFPKWDGNSWPAWQWHYFDKPSGHGGWDSTYGWYRFYLPPFPSVQNDGLNAEFADAGSSVDASSCSSNGINGSISLADIVNFAGQNQNVTVPFSWSENQDIFEEAWTFSIPVWGGLIDIDITPAIEIDCGVDLSGSFTGNFGEHHGGFDTIDAYTNASGQGVTPDLAPWGGGGSASKPSVTVKVHADMYVHADFSFTVSADWLGLSWLGSGTIFDQQIRPEVNFDMNTANYDSYTTPWADLEVDVAASTSVGQEMSNVDFPPFFHPNYYIVAPYYIWEEGPLKDEAPPVTTVYGNNRTWSGLPVGLTLGATDVGGGVKATYYKIDSGPWTEGNYVSIPAPPDTCVVHTVWYRSVDNAGNWETPKSCTVGIDTIPPGVSVSGADDQWHSQPVMLLFYPVELVSAAGLPCFTQYAIDNGGWVVGAFAWVPAPPDTKAVHTVWYRSCDTCGNVGSAKAVSVKIDTIPPTLSAISPSSGPSGGGTAVTITGSDFTAGSSVSFLGTGSKASNVDVVSPTEITCTSPPGSGRAYVVVTSAAGISSGPPSAAGMFTYIAAPTVTKVDPNDGPAAGGTTVFIDGSGFSNATAVDFGAAAASSFTVWDSHTISATAPAGTGRVDVTVTAPGGGTSATSAADQFTYLVVPKVSAIDPTSGSTAGGTPVTTGSGFTGTTKVAFSDNAASNVVVVSDSKITCTSPAGNGGHRRGKFVTNPAGTSAYSSTATFAYVGPLAVSSITQAAVRWPVAPT